MILIKKQFINFLLLLSLPIIIGGLLSFAMQGGSSGIRLFFLSLFGIYPTLKFIHYKNINRQKSLLFFVAALIWWLIFCLHSFVLSASWLILGGNIDAFFIIQAVANTTKVETLEFLSFHWINLGLMAAVLIGIIAGYFLGLLKFFDKISFNKFKMTKSYRVILVLFIVLCLASYIIKPSRNNSPFVFWHKYAKKIENFKEENTKHKIYQQEWLAFADANISVKNDETQTHILVISESLTSKNMGICGYPRNTTPFMDEHKNELMVFCQAYSRYSTTIDAIKSMLTDIESDPQVIPKQSLLGFAKSAGFKTFWISNQDDAYLSSLFGDFSDEKVYHNKLSGRSSFSLDEEILPYIDKTLTDTSDKKLIVIHLIGLHPNYSARYSDKFKIYPNDKTGFDKINAELDKNNIGAITRQHRDSYDNAVVYQDWVFNEIFSKIKNNNSAIRSMTFLSDHGNEVGHEKDYAGHSQNTQAGYQIPIILWKNTHSKTGIDKNTPIEASLLDNYMLSVMGIETKYPQPIVWTDEKYQFNPPDNFPYWQVK